MVRYFFLLFFGLFLAGCGSKTDKDYMQSAETKVKKNNISDAVKAYENLEEKYPESSLAPEALYQLASLYQNNLVKGFSKENSLKKAVEIYSKIYEKYPKSKKAPTALFMKGYILANELKDYTEARRAYNLFLKKYPNDELITSAKEELKHIGLSPDEILNEKKQKHI